MEGLGTRRIQTINTRRLSLGSKIWEKTLCCPSTLEKPSEEKYASTIPYLINEKNEAWVAGIGLSQAAIGTERFVRCIVWVKQWSVHF